MWQQLPTAAGCSAWTERKIGLQPTIRVGCRDGSRAEPSPLCQHRRKRCQRLGGAWCSACSSRRAACRWSLCLLLACRWATIHFKLLLHEAAGALHRRPVDHRGRHGLQQARRNAHKQRVWSAARRHDLAASVKEGTGGAEQAGGALGELAVRGCQIHTRLDDVAWHGDEHAGRTRSRA